MTGRQSPEFDWCPITSTVAAIDAAGSYLASFDVTFLPQGLKTRGFLLLGADQNRQEHYIAKYEGCMTIFKEVIRRRSLMWKST